MKLLICLILALSFGAETLVEARRRHAYHGPAELNADLYPIFCDKWRKPTAGPITIFPALKVQCFTEIHEDFIDRELILDTTTVSEELGCALRLPRNVTLKVLSFQYDDITFRAAKVYSGSNCRHINATHVNLVNTRDTYGPFTSHYTVLQYRPDNSLDKLSIKLSREN